MSSNLTWHQHTVDATSRAKALGQKPLVLWFTGLSGAGKSTLANGVEQALAGAGKHSFLLDGDNVRHGLCSDLGFSDSDRTENLRRVGEVARLMVDAGLIVLAAFVSPFASDRQLIRERLPQGRFFEIYVEASLEACESRDPKGLYAKARRGEIKHMTGLDSPFEVPASPDLVVNTQALSPAEAVNKVLEWLEKEVGLDASAD
ncbi:adenylyl-sulfate kinase [Gallaecimonas pentaromativorans]|uniref:Adenylyl-sulfate kinase n=1 Tax=Gallaecimonas pentaromativorans TaxID=584787 RepID=A0A3N1PQN3_9GAMM|nr:adenylyl-sulfate kinase [Gallaecimonas pentaromativorans]ROQ30519.1 adenylylsulfate kinase [Gallaecimonas pentaromativorans]